MNELLVSVYMKLLFYKNLELTEMSLPWQHPAWTVLDVSQRIPQTPLRPSLMVGQHLIGGDESSAIRFESENQGSNLPRVKLSKSGIGKVDICSVESS